MCPGQEPLSLTEEGPVVLESQEATCSGFTSLTPFSQGLLQRYLMEPKGRLKGRDMAHSRFSLGLGEIDLLW